MYNPYLFNFFPCVPSTKPLRPPLLYDLMNSIVNFSNNTPVSIIDLSEEARKKIFNFKYPLSDKVNKSEFEVMILEQYINRRIGFETFTLWQIKLKNKLNTIMPTYNKMFDAIEDWNLFADGLNETIDSSDNRNKNDTSNKNITNTTNISDTNTTKISDTNTTNISEEDKQSGNTTLDSSSNTSGTFDKRFSDMPENQLSDIQNGNYLSQYDYEQTKQNDTANSSGTSSNTNTRTGNNTNTRTGENTTTRTGNNTNTIKEDLSNNETDNNTHKETRKKDVENKIEVYTKFLEAKANIMELIYKELDPLFYNVVD